MTKIVGILNVTPDSFSDGGKYTQINAALEHAKQLLRDGAEIIDIGAESTRPNAQMISIEEEWQRIANILPAVITLTHAQNKQVSLDSRNYANIAKAIELGIDIVNDVSGCVDQQICALVAKAKVKIILMHNLGIPADPAKIINPRLDIVQEIKNWAKASIAKLAQHHITQERIIFDVGIGFGKNAEQCWEILKRIDEFTDLGNLYIGHSRKSFLKILGDELDRDLASAVISGHLFARNIAYLRVHNVALTKQVINISKKVKNE